MLDRVAFSAGHSLMVIDPGSLVDHRTWVDGEQTVGEIFQLFTGHKFDFMAVLEKNRVLGLCCRRDIGMLLGGKYGFSLYAQKPIREHLHPNPACVDIATPLNQIFRLVFAREDEFFYDDVLLVGEENRFVGLIHTQTLVKLQNHYHLDSIHLLERQREEISSKNELIESDLRMSRELQLALLPEAYPVFPAHGRPETSAFRFSHCYHPHDLVGGDFFYVKQISDSMAGVLIADVMGHGVRSALVTAILRTMLEAMGDEFTDPARLLGNLNRGLYRILTRVENGAIYATALYVLLDARGKILRCASAGHPLPLHTCPGLGRVDILAHPEPGMVLGVFDEADYDVAEHAYTPGDSIILYTDGLIEVENEVGEVFGSEYLLPTVRGLMNRPAKDLNEALLDQARNFATGKQFTDDVCLLAVETREWQVHDE